MSTEAVSSRTLDVRGSSGAVFTAFSEHAIEKTGDDRVVAQGHFMLDHETLDVFPKIHAVTGTSYVMDRLTEVPYDIINPLAFIEEMIATLGLLWSEDPVIELDRSAHIEKRHDLCTRMRVNESIFGDVRDELDFSVLPKVRTHGDATLENVMLGQDGLLLMIDPIPATPAVPDLRCVDVGKMLQSVYGFEKIRYGNSLFPGLDPNEAEDIIFSQLDMDFNEILAAKYWAMFHFLRAMPYMKTNEERRKIKNAIEGIYVGIGL